MALTSASRSATAIRIHPVRSHSCMRVTPISSCSSSAGMLRDVVVELEARLGLGEAAQDLLLAAIGARDLEDARHGGDELAARLRLAT